MPCFLLKHEYTCCNFFVCLFFGRDSFPVKKFFRIGLRLLETLKYKFEKERPGMEIFLEYLNLLNFHGKWYWKTVKINERCHWHSDGGRNSLHIGGRLWSQNSVNLCLDLQLPNYEILIAFFCSLNGVIYSRSHKAYGEDKWVDGCESAL